MGIWQANVGDSDVGSIDIDAGGDDALVTRPDADVEILPAGAAAFIETLQAGSPIIDAMKEGLFASPGFNLASTLPGMIEANVIVGYGARPAGSFEAA